MRKIENIISRFGQPFRSGWVLPTLVMVVWGIVTALWWFPRYYPSGDGGTYLVLAKSISEGKGYRDLRFPSEPVSAHFPPAWPIALAPIYKVFGLESVPYHAFASFLFLVGAFVLFRLGVRMSGNAGGLLAALALLLQPLMCEFSQSTLSEIPFALVLYLVFLVAHRAESSDRNGVWLGLIVLVVFAPLVRFVGEVLPVVLLAYLAIRRKWSLVVVLAFAVFFKLLFQVAVHGSGMLTEGYFATDFAVTRKLLGAILPGAVPPVLPGPMTPSVGFMVTVALNVRRLLLTFVPLNLMPTMYHLRPMGPVKMAACLVSSVWVVAGAVRAARRNNVVMVLSVVALTAAVLTRANSTAAYRYYAPLAPVWVLFAWVGAQKVGKLIAERWGFAGWKARGVMISAVAVFACDHAVYNVQQLHAERFRRNPELVAEYLHVMSCLKKHLPDNVVMCAPASASTYLFSGHKTIPFEWRNRSPEAALGSFTKSGADILILPGWWNDGFITKTHLVPKGNGEPMELGGVQSSGSSKTAFVLLPQNLRVTGAFKRAIMCAGAHDKK